MLLENLYLLGYSSKMFNERIKVLSLGKLYLNTNANLILENIICSMNKYSFISATARMIRVCSNLVEPFLTDVIVVWDYVGLFSRLSMTIRHVRLTIRNVRLVMLDSVVTLEVPENLDVLVLFYWLVLVSCGGNLLEPVLNKKVSLQIFC